MNIKYMKIKYVNGKRFRLATIAAAQKLINNTDYLNKINVFPVPDGDTGTNMASTLHAIIESLRYNSSDAIDSITRDISDSALMSARGNSGTILAQFFFGIAEKLQNKKKVSTKEFAKAVESSFEYAYDSLIAPKEGTILSVIKEWSLSWNKLSKNNEDFVDILAIALKNCQIELEKSPSKLRVLKDSHVVDAGAQGFVNMLEGINEFIKGGKIREIWEELKELASPYIREHQTVFDPNIKYRYCTECIVNDCIINNKQLKEKLKTFGDSLIIAGGGNKTKIHIHTDTPNYVFEMLSNYGKVKNKKADDMKKQIVQTQHKEKIGIVVDSACDLSEELLDVYNINVVPIRINFGDENYIDRVTLNLEEFQKKLETSPHHPKTSQPPPRDFVNMYRYLISHYEHIISIHISKNASGTFQNAFNAAKQIAKDRIHIIDSKGASIVAGIIAIKVAEMVKNKVPIDEIVQKANKLANQHKTYIIFDTLEYIIKGGRLNKNVGKILKFLKLVPIIGFDKSGKLVKKGILRKRDDNWKKVIKKMKKELNGKEPTDIGIVHFRAKRKAMDFKIALEKIWSDAKYYFENVGPAISAHGGPGLVGALYFVDE
ncbi:MAG: DegV family protein [Candidatus Marinimicrobia bacterium]|nr:DegV family protein [Candidatus Neomarinimicrobiota bacterium]